MTARYLHDFYTNSLADCKYHMAKHRVEGSLGDKSQPQKFRDHEALEIKTGFRRKAEAQSLTPTQNLITVAMSQSSGSDHVPKWQS